MAALLAAAEQYGWVVFAMDVHHAAEFRDDAAPRCPDREELAAAYARATLRAHGFDHADLLGEDA